MTDAAEVHRRLHRAGKFRADGGLKKQPRRVLRQVMDHFGCRTLLDYGCGQARWFSAGKHRLQPLSLRDEDVSLYDPYSGEHAAVPAGPSDLTLCNNVMEHVPPQDVPRTLEHLGGLTRKVAFFIIPSFPLKDRTTGLETHFCVRPREWWRDVIARHVGVPYILREELGTNGSWRDFDPGEANR